jgi:hypothetical protein
MNKLLVKLQRNKKNGQINLSLPKKKIKDSFSEDKISKAKKAWISLEGFE